MAVLAAFRVGGGNTRAGAGPTPPGGRLGRFPGRNSFPSSHPGGPTSGAGPWSPVLKNLPKQPKFLKSFLRLCQGRADHLATARIPPTPQEGTRPGVAVDPLLGSLLRRSVPPRGVPGMDVPPGPGPSGWRRHGGRADEECEASAETRSAAARKGRGQAPCSGRAQGREGGVEEPVQPRVGQTSKSAGIARVRIKSTPRGGDLLSASRERCPPALRGGAGGPATRSRRPSAVPGKSLRQVTLHRWRGLPSRPRRWRTGRPAPAHTSAR